MRLIPIVTAFFVLPQSALGQTLNILHPTGSYTQQPTGMVFPEGVDQFRRVNIIRYRDDGSDESAGYAGGAPMQEINMTVYVFPSPPQTSIGSPQEVVQDARGELCRRQYQGILREIMTAHPDTVPVQQEDISHAGNGVTYNGRVLTVDYTGAHYAGRTDVALRSQVYYFCYVGGKWSVEYRVDYPRDFDATSLIAGFMKDLAWTIPPEQK